jgi:archaellum component FlaC
MRGHESNIEKLSAGYRAIIEARDKELAEWKTWVKSHVPRLERERDAANRSADEARMEQGRLHAELNKRLAQIEAHQATVMSQQDEIERLKIAEAGWTHASDLAHQEIERLQREAPTELERLARH